MAKPKRLEVVRHVYGDGWNPGTYIAAHFDKVQPEPPDGWQLDEQWRGDGVRYIKRFPYGADVVTDRAGYQYVV